MQEEQPPLSEEERAERLRMRDLPLNERSKVAEENLKEKLKGTKKKKKEKKPFVPPTYAAIRSESMDKRQDEKTSRGSLEGYEVDID